MAGDDLLKKKHKGDHGGTGATTHGKSNGKGAGVGGFQHLGLSPPVFRGVMAMGYKVPTPIQRKSLPIVLSGKDCVAMARTGSGKTAAFLIPMLEKLKEHSKRIGVRALVLSPTRELAVQTLRFAKALAKFTTLKISLIVGGEGMEHQFETIAANPDVLVATPGRLMHQLQEIPDFNLKAIEYVVFDEADRIFEMGFAEQLQEIIKNMPTSRQTLLFSATLPKALVQFARAGLSEPELIRLDVENKFSENLKMSFFTVRSDDKPALFLYMVRDFIPKDDQTIVFAATRHHVEFLHELLLANHIESSCVYGDMDQASRKINIGKFRAKKTNVLIVTDVAARGIDIPLLNNVLNYSFPPTAKLFVHRVGRAARAGRSGTAFNFVDPDETPFMVDLHLYIGRRLEDSAPTAVKRGYSLATMRVEDIHYGAFPNELIDHETEFMQETLRSHPQVSPLVKVCANANKMYTRTRADPSKLSIKRAKELLVKKVHPLFQEEYTRSEEQANKAEYIESLLNFRPPQTIFEIAAGAHSVKKTAPAVVMMASKRKLHEKIIQTEAKKAKLTPTGVPAAVDDEEQDSGDKAEASGEQSEEVDQDGDPASGEDAEEQKPKAVEAKPKKTVFLSKFERKQIKKRVAAGEREEDVMKEMTAAKQQKLSAASASTGSGEGEAAEEEEDGAASTFKDRENYISYMKEGDYMTEEFLSKGADGGKVNAFQEARLEEAILDVNPDEAIELNKKRRILHWDVRKKKFVKTTAGELTSQGTLKRRNESGALMGRRKKQVAGELYKKWQQKQHKKVFTGGQEGEDDEAGGRKMDYRNGKKPHLANKMRVNKHAKPELLGESSIRKEEKRKARSRGVKVTSSGGNKGKRGKGNIKGKAHGAPSRSKAIMRR